MRLRYAALALAELDAILAYLSEHDVQAVQGFQTRLQLSLDRVAQFPKSAPPVRVRPGVRRLALVRYPYVVFYRVDAGEVMVLRILHGARNEAESARP